MSKLRAALWAVAHGVLSVVVAALLFRTIPGNGLVFLGLLLLCTAFLGAMLGLLAEVPAAVGATGGAFAALLIAVILGATIAVAPLREGAHRPELRDLLWQPLLALVGATAVSALAGWFGVRTGTRVARRGR